MLTEPDISKSRRQPEKESFFDYESQRPQDRVVPKKEIQGQDAIVEPGKQKRTAQDIVREMMSYRPPKPTYDPQRPEELKRLARTSAIGKGINILGDVIGLGAGANVKRRQPDNRELGYLDNYYRYLDDYRRRMDDWNWKDYMSRLRGEEMALSQANQEANRTLKEKQLRSEQAWKMLGFKSEQDWKEHQKQQDIEDRKLDRDKLKADTAYKEMTAKERERHNRQMELASMIRAQKTGRNTSSSKTFTIYDGKGNPVQLGENEREKILSLILSDPNTKLTQTEMDLLSPAMGEPVSTNTMNTLVQKYWEQIPSARDYIYSKYGNQPQKNKTIPNIAPSFRPPYNGPLRPGATPSVSPQTSKPKQETAVQPQSQSQEVVNDSVRIQNEYEQLGININQGTAYENAMQVAIKKGIIDPDSNPTTEQLQQVREIAKQIENDKETLRTAEVTKGVGFIPEKKDTTEVPLFFQ